MRCHTVHSSDQKGLVLKLDYEKAFDKVDLDFLAELLQARGFGTKWISWIHSITHGGSVGVKLNNTESSYFTTDKGLRQGDPLSPLLFNLVVDALTRMLAKVANQQLISGLYPDICPGGVICLQYADDTILFLDNNLEHARNLKTVLSWFEQVSGMRINYEKSELIPINLDEDELHPFFDCLGCSQGKFPIKYLGIPLHYEKLSKRGHPTSHR